MIAGLALACGVVQAQQDLDFAKPLLSNEEGEDFLPGVNDGSQRDRKRPTESYDADREVNRWEKRSRRGRVLSRETWTDEDGLGRGRFSIGRPF